MELMGDENDRIAFFLEVQKLFKQFLRLLRRQNGGRLVQDYNLCPAVHGF